MARTRQQYYADNVGLKKDGREFYLNDELLAKLENVPSVIDNVTSTSATDALSANMGRVLQDQINQLSSVGTFLSLWDCTTGLPETDPAVNPYQYKTWDYYIVSKIAEEGENNYRPRWTQYDVGIASTVVETEDIQVWDWYLYDWAKWIKQDNTGKEYPIDDALSLTSTNAVENRVVTAALNDKQDLIDDLDDIRDWAEAGSTALQPWDNITELINNAGYQTEWDITTKLLDYYDKDEVDALLDDKADKATTYTKTEVDDKIEAELQDAVKDWVLTIQKNWTDQWTFSANQSTDKTINITMDKADVWLENVDNTSDLNKPISTATQDALDLKADKTELPTLTTQVQTTPWEPITALVKDGDNEVRFDVAGNTIQMDFTNENGSNTRFLATKEYVDENMSAPATDTTYWTVKTNSEKWIRLDSDWALEIDGRRWKFPSTTWLYAPDNRDPRNVADYSVMVTDALWMNMTANRSLAIVSGYWVTCQSAPAGSTVYKLSNTYANRLKAKCCEWWFISLDEPTSKVKRIVPVTSVLIWGRTFHPDSVSDSSTPIEITVEETVNPDKATTSIRLFGTMNSYASLHIWNWVSSGASGRSLMIGWGITKNNWNDNCMVWMDMYATGNGNAMFWRYHIARKNRWFLAGTGHDTTNARTEWASAVWEYSMIDANTLFAVGNGTNHTTRSNAFEVRTDGIVLKSPNWTRWKITVDNSGTLTTVAI